MNVTKPNRAVADRFDSLFCIGVRSSKAAISPAVQSRTSEIFCDRTILCGFNPRRRHFLPVKWRQAEFPKQPDQRAHVRG
jgi:hypothetical protein